MGGGGLEVELVVLEIDTVCVVEIDLFTCCVVVWLPLTPTPLTTPYLTPPPLTRAVLSWLLDEETGGSPFLHQFDWTKNHYHVLVHKTKAALFYI